MVCVEIVRQGVAANTPYRTERVSEMCGDGRELCEQWMGSEGREQCQGWAGEDKVVKVKKI